MVPRENENNAYVKFGGTKKEYYGIFRNGQYKPGLHDKHFGHGTPPCPYFRSTHPLPVHTTKVSLFGVPQFFFFLGGGGGGTVRITNGTSKIVKHIDAFVSGFTTFKMADMRTRGNRAFFFWFFMRKRRNKDNWMLSSLESAINASVASSHHLTLLFELDAILDLIHNSEREEKTISFPGTLGLVIKMLAASTRKYGHGTPEKQAPDHLFTWSRHP